MSDRTGFNKGAVLIDALRGEILDFSLGVNGSSGIFAVADDLRQTAVSTNDFPTGLNQVNWQLRFDPTGNQLVRVTAADKQGNRIGAYQRDISVSAADANPLPVYTTGLLYGPTAVGYTLKVGHIKSNGVVEQIVDVQYKNGQPTDKDAEPIGIDFA